MNEKRESIGIGIIVAVLGLSAVVVLLCSGLGLFIVLPAVQGAREAANRQLVTNNLTQLGEAMQKYHATFAEEQLNQDEEATPDEAAEQAEDRQPESVEEIKHLANQFKTKWALANGDSTFENASIYEVRETEESYRVTFESATSRDPNLDEPRHFLHVIMDKDGALIRCERAVVGVPN